MNFKVLRLLSENPSLSTRQIASQLGISNGSAYYCIAALIEKSFVKIKNFKNSTKKRHYLYLVTPGGIRQKALLTEKFLKLKLQEYYELKKEIASLEKEIEETTLKEIIN